MSDKDSARNSRIDEPAGPIDEKVGYGSDVAAQMLRRLDIPYIALTPGASYRGLHDSLVNHLGNRAPEMLVCLHEEHAASIAQGYAKATGRAMAVAVHSNVGLLHASMTIFTAWCDRQPMLILGATGPVDAALRRPWIDWIHTSQDQGGLVRNFVKWDDQPGSIEAIPESMLRAWQQTMTAPHGPVYVCLDAAVQEQEVGEPVAMPDLARYRPAPPPRADAAMIKEAAEAIAAAKRPVILYGRCRRTQEAWDNRVELAERMGALMLSDLKAGSMVPTDHPLHAAPPINKLSKRAREALGESDLVLSFDWIDLGGALRQAFGKTEAPVKVIHAGQDLHLHNGWGKEHLELPPVDIHLLADPDACVADLLALLPDTKKPLPAPAPAAATDEASGGLNLRDVARVLVDSVGDTPITYAALGRGWPADLAPHRDPLAYLGKDGGGGVGSGPGLVIGAALALKGSGRMAVGILGDGDTLMSINALWTAARYEIPALFIINNNRSYYNDELHQEGVARYRGRNPENRWIGQSLDNPAPDIAKMAEAQGVMGIGPITDRDALADAIARAVECVRGGKPCLVDVHVDATHGRNIAESSAERSFAKK